MRSFAVVVCAIVLVAFALDVSGARHVGSFGGGIRPGDVIRLDRMPILDRMSYANPFQGQLLKAIVGRGQHFYSLRLHATRANRNSILTSLLWLLALLYAAMTLLVAWRATKGRSRTTIIVILSTLALTYASENLALAFTSPVVRFTGRAVSDLCIVVFLIAAYLFVLWFPPRQTRALPWLWKIGLPVNAASAVVYALDDVGSTLGVTHANFHTVGDALTILASAAMIVAVADAVRGCAQEYRKRTVIAGSTLVLLALVNVLIASTSLLSLRPPVLQYVSLLQWASGFGVSYAVLRYRLLDLNVIISRAAIFSTVSLGLLGVFALSEWVFATLMEKTLGARFDANGKTALAASIALVVGLSAGAFHRVVEHRLNRLFFAKRYRALADLHRFSLETDTATDSNALLQLTLNVLRRDLDADYVALYTGSPESGYVAAGTNVSASLPIRIDQNEETVLRLRRWGEAFVVEHETHPFFRAYMSPMMLRGTLFGFVLCGPKRDRTSYLPDEQETVAALVHRVGIAYEWLTRAPATVR